MKAAEFRFRDILTRCIRVAAAFGVASMAASGAILAMLYFRLPLGGAGLIASFMLSGAIGGALWAASEKGWKPALREAVAFGVGFIIPGLLIPFSLISLAQVVDLFWAAISWGLSLGLGAGLAGLLLSRPSHGRGFALPLAGAFAIGGATGGPLAFALFGAAAKGPGTGLWAFPLGLLVAYALGGALFALTLGVPALPQPVSEKSKESKLDIQDNWA